jgi:hypothetical protein
MYKLPINLIVLFSFLAFTGCDQAGVTVDTSPIGSGLATIGLGIVVAAFVGALLSGGE